jgi:hypothetical protein
MAAVSIGLDKKTPPPLQCPLCSFSGRRSQFAKLGCVQHID